jgi:hypothetical protein
MLLLLRKKALFQELRGGDGSIMPQRGAGFSGKVDNFLMERVGEFRIPKFEICNLRFEIA